MTSRRRTRDPRGDGRARAAITIVAEATVAELAHGGDGVAFASIGGERRAVFVPGVAPGEALRIAIDPSTRPARGRALAILGPSADRVAPPCPVVDACGACDWMFLSPAAQAREHAELARRALGKLLRARAVTAHPADVPVGYRTRARVHVEASRGRVVVGMHGRRSREPVSTPVCVVLDPAIDAVRTQLPALLAGARGRGEAAIALGKIAPQRRAVVDVRFEGDLPDAVFARVDASVREGVLDGARIFAGDVRVPAVIGDPTPWLVGADGAPIVLAPGGFAQATESGNARLASRVAELAAACASGQPIVELYAGAGNLTVLLARAHAVTAVEEGADACAAARENLRQRNLEARVVVGDAAAHALPRDLRLLVLDPPRTGARDVVTRIAATHARARPRAIVYVSCDLPTLARDLAVLGEAGYALESVDTFEMFPQTSHVETVAFLVRESA